jgi:threonyl-tRNA synthetase
VGDATAQYTTVVLFLSCVAHKRAHKPHDTFQLFVLYSVGKAQNLFFFHDLSPGSCFFQPHGTRIYNKLQELIKDQYEKRGFDEVISPNMYNVDLWKTSGHYQNYAENMFSFQVENAEFALKPMNCPGHCLMFGHQLRSYR